MKKWTYLVAAGMLLGATPVFTGCIDNDEPEGITVLRGAKAELLKAKASVELARVDQIKAEAALKLAEAEVKKAEAARVQAMADFEAARAKEMEYKAELANITNEEKRADLENKIKMYAEQRADAERAAKKAAAELEVQLMKLKASLATQQASYEEALKNLALAKNTLTAAQKAHLESWSTAVSSANDAVKAKAEAYERAAKALATAIKTMDKDEAKESYLREQKKAVADAQVKLDAAIAARDLAKEFVDKKIEAADKWEAEMTKLEADLDAIKIKVADLKVDKEKLTQENAGLLASANELRDTYMGLTGYTWNAEEGVFNTEIGESAEEIVLEEINILINEPALFATGAINVTPTFLYSDKLKAEQESGEFIQDTKTRLLSLKQQILSLKLSANGIAWTESILANDKASLVDLKEVIATNMANWELYVKAYKDFKHGDPTPFEGFAKIEEVIAEYNKAVQEFNTAKAELADLKETLSTAEMEYEADVDAINIKLAGERIKIENEYNVAIAAIKNTLDDLKNKESVAFSYWQKCVAELALIASPTDADKKKVSDAKTAYDGAKEALAKGQKEADGYIEGGTVYVGTLEEAEILRDKKYDLALKTAENEYAKLTEAFNKEYPNEVNKDKLVALTKVLAAAQTEVFAIGRLAANEIMAFCTLHNVTYDGTAFAAAYNNRDEEGNPAPLEITAKDAARIDIEVLEEQLISASQSLFGETLDGENAYLVAPKVEDFKAAIESAYLQQNPNATFIPFYVYLSGYSDFGLVGYSLSLEGFIARGELVLAENGAKVNEYAALVQAEVDKIDAQIEAYTNDVVKPAFENYNTSFVVYNSKFEEVDNAIAAATAEENAISPVLEQIKAAIAVYLSQEMKPDGTPAEAASIQDLRETLQEAYDAAVTAAYNAETALITAKEAMQGVINDTKSPVEAAQEKVADYQKALEAAQATLKAAVEALQAEIERISAE